MTRSLGGERALPERQPQFLPHVDEGFRQRVDEHVVVIGTGRDAQPLRTFRHCRIVDRLNVNCHARKAGDRSPL